VAAAPERQEILDTQGRHKPWICGIPHRVLAAVPCLRRDGVLASVPDLGLGEAVCTRPARRLPAGLAVDFTMMSGDPDGGLACRGSAGARIAGEGHGSLTL